MRVLVALSLLVGSGSGFLFGGPAWNDLRVKWGIPGVNKNIFQGLPRTTEQATGAGWVPRTDFCAPGGSPVFRGFQYWKGGDPAVILLFDRNGYIAGIQSGIPKSQYMPSPFAQNVSFIDDGQGLWLLTVYFVKPFVTGGKDFICGIGRSSSDFKSQGTGNRFYIQNGTDPTANLVPIPLAQADLNPTNTPGWNFGKCFYSIGNNFWYRMSVDMDCHHIFPINVIYNGGQLNAFSFLVNAKLTSPRFEHFTIKEAGLVMNPVPTCLFDSPDYKDISAMHVYMASCTLPAEVCQLC